MNRLHKDIWVTVTSLIALYTNTEEVLAKRERSGHPFVKLISLKEVMVGLDGFELRVSFLLSCSSLFPFLNRNWKSEKINCDRSIQV